MTATSRLLPAAELGTFRGGSGFPVRYQGRKSGDLPFFKVSDMNSEGNELFMTSANNYISESRRKTLGATRMPARAIVFAKVGAAIFQERRRILTQDSCIDNNMAAFIVDETRLDIRLAYYLLTAFKMSDLVSVGALPSLNGGQLRSIPLLVPNELAEQRRIAAALADADDLVSALERHIVKKQAIRQGIIQQLLTGRTRLPGHVDKWSDVTVAALARVVGGGTPSTRVSSYWGGSIPWFTPGEIKAEGSGPVVRSARTITPDGLANSSATLLPAGSILVTSRASIGHCAVLEAPGTTNQGFASLVPKRPGSTWFLYYWIQQNRAALESRAAGSTFLEISASRVAQIPLACPSIDEQRDIGEVLRDLDLGLDALHARHKKARAIKTGMMQQLLTGRCQLAMEAA